MLPAAKGAYHFCFSPDSRWIAFQVGSVLKKMPITGGAATTLFETGGSRGFDWADDDLIVYGSFRGGLAQISAAGGTATPLTTLTPEERTHRWPQVLPGGRAVVFTANTRIGGYDDANIMVQRLPAGEPQLVMQGGFHARYVSSGHLVYIHQGTLFAMPFDLGSLTISGQPIPVLKDVATNNWGGSHFDVSAEGTLVYLQGRLNERLYELEWVDREGNRELLLPKNDYGAFAFSPDGRFLAYVLRDSQQRDIWIHDIEQEVSTKLTLSPAEERFPIWSPSGESIVYLSDQSAPPNLHWKRVDGSGEARRLVSSQNTQFPWAWHPEGTHLAIYESPPGASIDLRIAPLERDDELGWTAGEIEDFVASPFAEACASFSPDGRRLAYASNESGTYQVYVSAFPGKGGRKQISTTGNHAGWPAWSRTADELIFESWGLPEAQIVIARYRVEDGIMVPERPIPWPGATFVRREVNAGASYALHPDGKRLLIAKRVTYEDLEEKQTFDHVILFQNFVDYLRENVPSG